MLPVLFLFFFLAKNDVIKTSPLLLRVHVSKYRPEVYKSEKTKILKKIHKVALGKLST